MGYFVYILYSKSIDRFYIGITKDVDQRLSKHNAAKTSYTAAGKPWALVWKTVKDNRKKAETLEKKLKNLTRKQAQKIELVFTEVYFCILLKKNVIGYEFRSSSTLQKS